MDNDGIDGERAHDAPAAHVTAPPAKRRRKWPYVVFAIVFVFPLLAFATWSAAALHWSYSEGNRAGFIQKFSKKGWLCKTWEGELAQANMPGALQERFLFSVRDDSVAAVVNRLMGSRVSITYEQHPGIPTRCFGETEYFVTGVRALH